MKRKFFITALAIACIIALGFAFIPRFADGKSRAGENGYATDEGNSYGGTTDYVTGTPSSKVSETADPQVYEPSYDMGNYAQNTSPPIYDDWYHEPEEWVTGESYLAITENETVSTASQQTLTFSLKVDTAAYTNIVRCIEGGYLPSPDAVRIEEMLNYFKYDNQIFLENGAPFGIYTEVGQSPLDSDKTIAMVRVKTEDIDVSDLPSSNLVFLIDTSGSMSGYDRIDLLKESLTLLVEDLDEDDTISIVTYAGSSRVLLDSVKGDKKDKILKAINNLSVGGSTAGGEGIITAYKIAEKNFLDGGNNRIILASDGDFNVGITNLADLEALITEKRESGVYLSVLGFGEGNLRDDIMETLSKSGNGNYSYINDIKTAKKVLVDERGATLFTVAADVKAQVEFNPDNVSSYRLIGYENRLLNNKDFEDDTKDAGEIGVGTDVIMLFELELYDNYAVKYTASREPAAHDNELFEVRIRYKDPGESESKLVEKPVFSDDIKGTTSMDFNFANAVASFGYILRGSEDSSLANDIIKVAEDSIGEDENGYRHDFYELVRDYSLRFR